MNAISMPRANRSAAPADADARGQSWAAWYCRLPVERIADLAAWRDLDQWRERTESETRAAAETRQRKTQRKRAGK